MRNSTTLIRQLDRHDGDLLDQVMAGMGPQSRYQRFHSPKPRYTSSDRAFLTNVDPCDHIGLVALDAGGDPIGVARAVRLKDDPAAAELGVEVVDARQREGLGTDLIRSVARRAVAAGIERLVANVLAESRFAQGLRRRGWEVTERDGPVVTLEIYAWRVAGEARLERLTPERPCSAPPQAASAR